MRVEKNIWNCEEISAWGQRKNQEERTGRSSTKPSGLKGDRPILTVGNNGTGVSPALLCGVGSSGVYLPYECTVFYIFLWSGSVGWRLGEERQNLEQQISDIPNAQTPSTSFVCVCRPWEAKLVDLCWFTCRGETWPRLLRFADSSSVTLLFYSWSDRKVGVLRVQSSLPLLPVHGRSTLGRLGLNGQDPSSSVFPCSKFLLWSGRN